MNSKEVPLKIEKHIIELYIGKSVTNGLEESRKILRESILPTVKRIYSNDSERFDWTEADWSKDDLKEILYDPKTCRLQKETIDGLLGSYSL